jgi:hypothetical protein
LPDGGPVFVFTVHRSGGTLLGRLLNCHPELVLWGEHGGILNKLAEIDYLIERHSKVMTDSEKEWVPEYVDSADLRSQTFQPWTTSHDFSGFRAHARASIKAMFTNGLAPGQRWGFKEIRYHNPRLASYLAGLVPASRFVLLRRAIPDAAVSNILAAWSQDRLAPPGGTVSPELAEAIVRDVVYALLVIDTNFRTIQAAMPARCFTLDYAELAAKNLPVILLLFDFLGLGIRPEVTARVGQTLKRRFNETEKRSKFGGALTADFIATRAAELLPELNAEIAANGIDHARLRARSGLGKYSFMTGDHAFEDGPISCMF